MSFVVPLQPQGSRTPFFWVHGEKSNALLPGLLGPDQPLFGVLHQSHDGRRAQFTKMEDIAAYYLGSVRRFQPKGPYRLGGFCIGATLAFEMARQLHQGGETVGLLVMLDPPVTGPAASPLARIPTQTAGSESPSRAPRTETGFGRWLAKQFGQLARLSGRERVSYLWDGLLYRLSELRPKPDRAREPVGISGVAPEAADRIMNPYRRTRYINAAHYRAKLGYLPQSYPGKIIVLRTEGGCRDPESVWGPLAGGGLEVIDLPGRHTEIVEAPEQIENLASQLKACLEAAG